MYYCGDNFSAKYLITNIAGFSVGDIVVVKTSRDGGRNVGPWLVVLNVTPTTKGQGYLTVKHTVQTNAPSPALGPAAPNDWISEGDFIAKAPSFVTTGNIVGPFVASTVNGIPISYYQPEDNYNASRHLIFNYSLLDETIPTSLNANRMSGTDWSSFNFSGICFYDRLLNKPRSLGGWNSNGNRIATMLSRQHVLICDHYPPNGRSFFVTDGSSFYNRQIRKSENFSNAGSDFSIPPGSPGPNIMGSGFMRPGLYPTWYFLNNGVDIETAYPEIPVNLWYLFSDVSIVTIKTPVPENATMLFALNKNFTRQVANFTTIFGPSLYTGPSPLIIQSSFHTVGIRKSGSTLSTSYSGLFNSSSAGSTVNAIPWNNKPADVNITDFLGGVGLGDSSSVKIFKFVKPDNTIGFIYGGMTLSAGSSSGIIINSSGNYVSCTEQSSQAPCSLLNTYPTDSEGSGFSMFDEYSYKIIKIMLSDKSWQITQANRIISNNPELNIEESDLIETYPRVFEFDSLVDPNTYISNMQALSLSSGINYFSSEKVFKGVPKEVIFNNIGCDLFTIQNELYPDYNPVLLDFSTSTVPNLPAFYKLSDTVKTITDTTINPNEQRQIFKYGGDLTNRLSLEEINKSFNTSGMIVYKAKK